MRRLLCGLPALLLPLLLLPAQASDAPTADGGQNAAEYRDLGFDGMDNPQVEAHRRKYLTTHREWLSGILEDAEPYRIYVRNEIERRGMPAILEYLPVVESNYIPTAKSKSGAVGLWQFMLNSVAPFLQYDDYLDERLDPWKSTQAALSKLQDNYAMFGDWLLAITAYNCGAGAMRRALAASSEKSFWRLSERGLLSEQAAQYVPKLLAVADVVENAAFYGISMPTARGADGRTLEIRAGCFDYVSVSAPVPLRRISQELRIDEEFLASLNLALRTGTTPPGAEYRIRLPEGMKDSAVRALQEMGFFTAYGAQKGR